MSGVVAGLIGSVKAAAAGVVNLVTNGSFTTTDLTNWGYIGTGTERTTSVYKTSPASLAADSFGENDPTVSFYKTNTLTVGSTYSLSFWLRTPTNLNSFTYSFDCGTTNVTTTTPLISPSTSWLYYKVENVVCAGNGTLSFMIYSGTNFQIDDVYVVAGATAV
jgi:hypothetical protein